ncbi:DUF6629 family protein [Streptomyces sp. NBC_01750]|uniref:DUF6629 family protein n=1 Tax=Streptomyces sp. NBC_01750 TaxID=2975928 RepID=UPI002DDA72EE|nr:DUF6629 family protein [Streptomyces sp. NBC_01750]WSD31160.1 hypothetical protein OG966_03955 [Streptomyces sp. NBC_01750]
MCWSATADLVGGTGIAAIGVACVVQAPRVRDLPLAALPLLLGTHQIVESAVWRSGGGTGPATVVWAIIALPLLPVWVPLGVLLAGDPVLRLLGLLAAAGAVASAVLWRLEFVSTWCALAAVASVVVLGWARRRPADRAPG